MTTRNGAVFQLDAALDFLGRVGLARIEKHGLPLAQELRERIAALGYETLTPPGNPSPIVSFVHGRDRKALETELERERVMVTFREGGSQIRASVALSTTGATSRDFSRSSRRLPEAPRLF